MSDDAAKAAFLAGLPTGKNGEPTPGHTTWEQLGPQAQQRYRRMTDAAITVGTAHIGELIAPYLNRRDGSEIGDLARAIFYGLAES